jgi:hypothetical protein
LRSLPETLKSKKWSQERKQSSPPGSKKERDDFLIRKGTRKQSKIDTRFPEYQEVFSTIP